MSTEPPNTEPHDANADAILSTVALAAGLLAVVSAIVHGATFFGIDPIHRYPHVMWIHLLVIAVFVAALYSANCLVPLQQHAGEVFTRCTPLWLQTLLGIAIAYAL